eukprot:g43208.t1
MLYYSGMLHSAQLEQTGDVIDAEGLGELQQCSEEEEDECTGRRNLALCMTELRCIRFYKPDRVISGFSFPQGFMANILRLRLES